MPTASRLVSLPSLACLVLLLSCGGDSPSDPGPGPGTTVGPPATVTVTPATFNASALGQTQQLGATARDASGNSITSPSLTWSSVDPTVATVSGSGLVTAVSNGTTTVTATAGSATGSATVSVQQVTASITLDTESVALQEGESANLTASAADANDNPVTDDTFVWSASPEGIVQVDTDASGTVATVTALAAGTATLTVSASSAPSVVTTATATVVADFKPTEDASLSGTAAVAAVLIPAGVTITATDDLTINALGAVTIAGTLSGDCVAINVVGSGAVTVTGTVTNACTGGAPETPPALNIVGVGAMTITGAVIIAAGDVEVTNDPSPASATAALAPGVFAAVQSAAAGEPCVHSGTTFTGGNGIDGADGPFNPSPPGHPGGVVRISCSGDLTLDGVTIQSGNGGRGGHAESSTGQNTKGGPGGVGGDVVIRGQNVIVPLATVTLLKIGHGGNGGNATTSGGPGPEADGGPGASPGLPRISGMDVNLFGLAITLGNGGDGGTGRAIATDGADATPTSAAQPGMTSVSRGGMGASVGGNRLLFGDLIVGNVPEGQTLSDLFASAGDGGDAITIAANGGAGGPGFEHGATGGGSSTYAGAGGHINLVNNRTGGPIDGVPGDGGDMSTTFGNGGPGWNGCVVGSVGIGGAGGPGGFIAASAGMGGSRSGGASGATGTNFITDAANGGHGEDGIPPGDGGPFGVWDQTGVIDPQVLNGTNFQPGTNGGPCIFPFDLSVTVLSDLNVHNPTLQATSATEMPIELFTDGFESGDTSRWSSMSNRPGGQAPGDKGTVDFSLTGSGMVAGFPDVGQSLVGTMTLDSFGRPFSFTAILTLDTGNNVFPPDGMGVYNPAIYNVIGTLQGN